MNKMLFNVPIIIPLIVLLCTLVVIVIYINVKNDNKTAKRVVSINKKNNMDDLNSENVPLGEEELIAVLTAAVANYMNVNVQDLVVKTYKRVQDNIPAWSRAGRKEQIINRY